MFTASEAWRGCIPFKSSDTSEQSAHFQHQLSVSQGSLPKTCCCCCFCCCCWSVISMSFHQCEITGLMLMLRMRLECGLMFHLCITDPVASRKVFRTYSSLPLGSVLDIDKKEEGLNWNIAFPLRKTRGLGSGISLTLSAFRHSVGKSDAF